jgi:hypothetical protein
MKKELLTRPLAVLVFSIALAFAGSTTYSQESEYYVSAFAKSERTDAARRLFKGLFG